MRISAYFFGSPGDPMDKAARYTFESFGGKSIGAGTWLVGAAAGERDVEYDVPDDYVLETKAALRKQGFRLEPTKDI